jgi:hypothetical protein
MTVGMVRGPGPPPETAAGHCKPLSPAEVVTFLLQRGLIGTSSIVDGDLSISEASRRNHNFIVSRQDGPWYLLKQGLDPVTRATIANEAWFYSASGPLGARPDGIWDYLPAFCGYDANVGVLVLEFVRESQDLRKYNLRRDGFALTFPRRLGVALALLHGPAPSVPASSAHWILSTFRSPTLAFYQSSSRACAQLISLTQRYPALTDLLGGLASDWVPFALIHGDVRWDNCVVFPAPHTRRTTRLKLVDWELAGRGDPCWDVGSVFCDYLWCWLGSIPDAGLEPSERLLDQAGYPLEAMHPAISAFWTGYTETMGLSPAEANTQALRATRYTAARLVQLTYEQLQTRPQITTTAIAAVQLSLNILNRPLEARAVLLGL